MATIPQRQLFLHHIAQTSSAPLLLEVERAEGIYLYGPQGQRTIDLISGISVCNLGHSYPAIVDAVCHQAQSYMHLMVYGEIVQTPQVQLAALLATQLPAQLDTVYFVNSGSEATEGSLKLAKRHTGRSNIISCAKAYHGSSHGALSVMGDEYFKQAYRPLLPGIGFIRFNNFDDLKKIDHATAAVIIEPVQGEAGIVIPQDGYLQALRQRCTDTGALLIFDEVQTGFGRTGKMFAFEHWGAVPDIINFAKGFGGGMPLGAFVSSRKIMDCLSHNPVLGHITTFGGHPVSCAAGLAMLTALISQPELVAAAQAKGQIIIDRLSLHPLVQSVHGIGLFLAAELGSIELRERFMREALVQGVLADQFLFREDCVRIAPPLVISENEIHEACDIIIRVLDGLID